MGNVLTLVGVTLPSGVLKEANSNTIYFVMGAMTTQEEVESETEESQQEQSTDELYRLFNVDALETVLEAAQRECESMAELPDMETETEDLQQAIQTVKDGNTTLDEVSADSRVSVPHIDIPGGEDISLGKDDVPTNIHDDSMLIDHHHGRPVLYVWQPDKEDSQFAIALPTEEDPNARLYINRGNIINQTDRILNSE